MAELYFPYIFLEHNYFINKIKKIRGRK